MYIIKLIIIIAIGVILILPFIMISILIYQMGKDCINFEQKLKEIRESRENTNN